MNNLTAKFADTAELNEQLFGTQTPVVMVTGSGVARVGRCIADYFATAGFHVILHGNRSIESTKQLARDWTAAGRKVSVVTGDVSDEAQVLRWKSEILDSVGRVDVLVNSAAIWDPTPLENVDTGVYEHFFRVNALGTALTNQHIGLLMTQQTNGGSIVNIGDWAVERPYRDFTPYFVSKAAVVSITQSMAIELATRNPKVRVNAILPGPVMLAEDVSEQRRQKIIRECLLQREGTAEDVARAAIFLATSPFITGVTLPVDGGRTIFAGPSCDPIAHPKVKDN